MSYDERLPQNMKFIFMFGCRTFVRDCTLYGHEKSSVPEGEIPHCVIMLVYTMVHRTIVKIRLQLENKLGI